MREVIKTNSETNYEYYVRLATCQFKSPQPLDVAGVLGTCIRLRKKLKTLNRRMQRIKQDNKKLRQQIDMLASANEVLHTKILRMYEQM